jgi:hypothetical protein
LPQYSESGRSRTTAWLGLFLDYTPGVLVLA